ncbi:MULTISPECIES: helix-turn-helix domain-containing protein [Bacillus cereus group]|uniref:helix-turn-helix domain-containing protein n=1 Tax=Bacillus cereus group TaxID=86661 RepID=UPI001F59261F|nr:MULTISPECIES: helix-turn-helix transcriptional regulator [unclassified Bacillus cereus group]EMA6341719.1 helix-turn-helix transcriptional regulator [Bacillus cytotoxicus]
MKVHEKIRYIRQNKGITQVYVAKKLNIPVQTYSGYELGRRRIDVELLKEIAKVLEIPIANFFK